MGKIICFISEDFAEWIKILGFDDPFPRLNYVDHRLVRDRHIITAKGRAFVDFSFEIFDFLGVYQGKYDDKEQLFKEIMNR